MSHGNQRDEARDDAERSAVWSRPSPELAQAFYLESGDALLIVDPTSLKILDVNPMTQRLTGLSRAAILGMCASDLIQSVQGAADWRASVEHTRHVSRPRRIPVAHRIIRPRSDQPDRFASALQELAPLAMLTVRDLRELHAALEQARSTAAELGRVLSSISDCAWNAIVGPGNRSQYAYISPRIEQLTGRPVQHFLDGLRSFSEAVHADDRDAFRILRLQVEVVGEVEGEYRFVRPDGSICWVSERLTCLPIAEGERNFSASFATLPSVKRRTNANIAGKHDWPRLRSLRVWESSRAASRTTSTTC
ncbi:MAG: PAS domain-containing protein [Pirellulales bacterium]